MQGKVMSLKYDGAKIKGYFTGPHDIKGILKFYCIQSTADPEKVLLCGDIILDQVNVRF